MADTGEEDKGAANGLNGMQRQFLGNSVCINQNRFVFFSKERASRRIVQDIGTVPLLFHVSINQD